MSASPAFLADRARAIKPSPSMAAKARVDQLRAQGRDIVDFTVGEPDLSTPAHIVRAGMEALRGGDIRYTASVGSRPCWRPSASSSSARMGWTSGSTS